MEIYTQARMSHIVDDIDVKLKEGKLKVDLDETLWVGLRKNECWHWNSDVAHCYSGWHIGYPTPQGGMKKLALVDQ
jgi:hypothetical protein